MRLCCVLSSPQALRQNSIGCLSLSALVTAVRATCTHARSPLHIHAALIMEQSRVGRLDILKLPRPQRSRPSRACIASKALCVSSCHAHARESRHECFPSKQHLVSPLCALGACHARRISTSRRGNAWTSPRASTHTGCVASTMLASRRTVAAPEAGPRARFLLLS